MRILKPVHSKQLTVRKKIPILLNINNRLIHIVDRTKTTDISEITIRSSTHTKASIERT